jgi:hypothetical protein
MSPRGDAGKHELNKGNDFNDNWGLLRNLRANFWSSMGVLRMDVLGGSLSLTFLEDFSWFFISSSSFRRRWGLLLGTSVSRGLLLATAYMFTLEMTLLVFKVF